jgi:hypothetical protein
MPFTTTSPSTGGSGNANTGDITFDGVKIIGAGTASGDGSGSGTIDIVPDLDLTTNQYSQDQYLIIDPTAPNHIHIRGGGTQDDSRADLFIGGERNHVRVSDQGKTVSISTKPQPITNTYTNMNSENANYFVVANTAEIYVGDKGYYSQGGDLFTVDSITPDVHSPGTLTIAATSYGTPMPFIGGGAYVFIHDQEWNNYWQFGSDGYLTGPAMGGLFVNGILNGESDLWLQSNDNVVLNGNGGGEFLGDINNSNNQIATIGDINNLGSGEVSFTVNGGTLGTQPTFDGAPLFSGTYVKTGPMIHFQIQVQMDNITDFGTGQYYVDLPFPAKYSYHFRDACLHDNSGTVRQYALSGHVYAGQSRVTLWFTSTSGQDELFDYNSPALLTVNDNFHISGTYIANE